MHDISSDVCEQISINGAYRCGAAYATERVQTSGQDQGEATRGFTVRVRGGHLILGRVDDIGPDPRFRLTPLGGGTRGLSLFHRYKWDPLPYEGPLDE